MLNKKIDVSVIIPFYDKPQLTRQCVWSLIANLPDSLSFEFLLINNNSSADTMRQLASLPASLVRFIDYPYYYNYHMLNNYAVKFAQGEVLFFLNNDTEFVTGNNELLLKMYKKACLKEIGAVGTLLLFEDQDTIQHAGVCMVKGGYATHLHMFKKISQPQENNEPNDYFTDSAMTAVTAAAMMLEKNKFLEVGGFDERFEVLSGDVDLCIRLNHMKYQSYYIGSSGYIIHKESQTRDTSHVHVSDLINTYRAYITALNHNLEEKFNKC